MTAPRPRTNGTGLVRGATVAVLLLVATSCASDAPARPAFVVGDSTMAQVEEVSGRGATQPGCGYTLHAPCQIPLRGSMPEGDGEVIVAAVSIWDFDASLEEIALGYQRYHQILSSHAPVIWVEVPPRFDEIPGESSYEKAAALNAAVSEALGCELAPRSLRHAPSNDGVHYANQRSTAEVAERLSTLSADDACPVPTEPRDQMEAQG